MFFVMGISQGETELGIDQTIICPVCGKFGHLRIRMVYTYLSLFFLPVLRWGKRYYASMRCCGAVCELDADLGRRIARGEVTSVDPASLHFSGHAGTRTCRRCGYATAEEFEFCPKCGTRF